MLSHRCKKPYGEADSCAHSRPRPLTHASTRALASESGLHAPLGLPWVWRAVAHASGRGTGVLPWLIRIAWLAGGQTQAVIQRTIEMRHHLGFSRWKALSNSPTTPQPTCARSQAYSHGSASSTCGAARSGHAVGGFEASSLCLASLRARVQSAAPRPQRIPPPLLSLA